MKKLNLGCGNSKIEGYINLDIDERNNPDILFNLNKYPYPFKDDEFEYILADSVIEHLDDFVKTMEELYRILKPGGELFIVVPFHKHHTAWGDPTHKRAFSEITFKYFADNLVPPCHNPIKKIFRYGNIKLRPTSIGSMCGPLMKYFRYFTELMVVGLDIKLFK